MILTCPSNEHYLVIIGGKVCGYIESMSAIPDKHGQFNVSRMVILKSGLMAAHAHWPFFVFNIRHWNAEEYVELGTFFILTGECLIRKLTLVLHDLVIVERPDLAKQEEHSA